MVHRTGMALEQGPMHGLDVSAQERTRPLGPPAAGSGPAHQEVARTSRAVVSAGRKNCRVPLESKYGVCDKKQWEWRRGAASARWQ